MNVWASTVQPTRSHKTSQNAFSDRYRPLSLESSWLKWNRSWKCEQRCLVLRQPEDICGRRATPAPCRYDKSKVSINTIVRLVLWDSCLTCCNAVLRMSVRVKGDCMNNKVMEVHISAETEEDGESIWWLESRVPIWFVGLEVQHSG